MRLATTGRPRRRAGGDDGQALVETVLSLGVIVLVMLAVVQVGLVVADQVLVVQAAREGARAAAVGEDPGGAAAAATGLDSSRLDVDRRGGATPGDQVAVVVRYRSPTDLPLVGPLIDDVDLSARVVMRVEG